MTSRQAVEWYVNRYPADDDKQAAKDFEASNAAEIARREEEDKKKSLAQRKAEYWAFSAENGCKEKDIQREWDEHLKGG